MINFTQNVTINCDDISVTRFGKILPLGRKIWGFFNVLQNFEPTLFIFTFGQFPIFENLAYMEQIIWPSGHTGHDLPLTDCCDCQIWRETDPTRFPICQRIFLRIFVETFSRESFRQNRSDFRRCIFCRRKWWAGINTIKLFLPSLSCCKIAAFWCILWDGSVSFQVDIFVRAAKD